jgi:hypothetical protein
MALSIHPLDRSHLSIPSSPGRLCPTGLLPGNLLHVTWGGM